jgi:hypothetical protein
MKKYFVIESMDEKTDLNGVIWQSDTNTSKDMMSSHSF